MGQVAFQVNGRTYRLSCRDGEEARVRELADYVNRKVERLIGEFGHIAPERLMLMAAILTADELWESREQLADLAFDTDELKAVAEAAKAGGVTQGSRQDEVVHQGAVPPRAETA